MAEPVKAAFSREILILADRADPAAAARQRGNQEKDQVPPDRRIACRDRHHRAAGRHAIARARRRLAAARRPFAVGGPLEQGQRDSRCLIADDDEAFTYNERLNRLATIQEHYMIVRALDRGVAPDKLAKVRNINVAQIRRRRTLLDGIAAEVVELLKNRNISPSTFDALRKMKRCGRSRRLSS